MGLILIAVMALVVFGTIAAVVAIVLKAARVEGRGGWRAAVGGPLGCAVLPLALLVLLVVGVTIWGHLRPTSGIYEQVFASAPPATITGLRGRSGGGMDYSHVYLAFDRTSASLAAIDVAASETDPASALVASVAGDGQAPAWWRPALDCPRRTERIMSEYNRWDDIAIIECPTLGRVFVLASSID